MKKEEFTPENKFRWISRMYFSVSDSPAHDVNPFEEMGPFLEATVKQMDWGKDPAKAKELFVTFFAKVLDLYDFIIPKEEIVKCLANDSMKNKDLVTHLASIGQFPEN